MQFKGFNISLCLLLFIQFAFADEKQNIKVNGSSRSYLVHLPKGYSPDLNKKPSLVIALHSGGESAEHMAEFTGFNAFADLDTVIVLYPSALEDHWNDGRYEIKGNPHHKVYVNDVRFIDSLIEKMIRVYNVDSDRVFLTGIANGAIMCYKAACQLSHKIAAIGPVLGSCAESVLLNCRPHRSISIIAINGSEDKLIPFDGGEIIYQDMDLGRIASVNETIQFWAQYNDTNKTLKPLILKTNDNHKFDGTIVYQKEFFNGRYQTEIILYLIKGGGHAWPGAKQFYEKGITGKVSKEINASELLWRFFKNHVPKN